MFNIIQPQSNLYRIAFTAPMKNIFHFSSARSKLLFFYESNSPLKRSIYDIYSIYNEITALK